MNLTKISLTLALIGTAFLSAAEQSPALVTLNNGYIFLPLKGSTVTAGYGTLENKTGGDVHISVVKAEGFKAVELHETIPKDDLMKMQKVRDMVLKVGTSLELRPGGSHIMLFDPTTELKAGDIIQVTFKLNDKEVALPFTVRSR